jgi:hypothetical protein
MTDAISSILSQIRAHEMQARGPLAEAPASNAIDVGGAGRLGGGNAVAAPGFGQTRSAKPRPTPATCSRPSNWATRVPTWRG